MEQSTLNEYQSTKQWDYFGKYLPEILLRTIRQINLLIKTLICIRPVNKIFSSLNVIFILIILTLSAFGASSWIYPKYPDRVNGEKQMSSSREIAHLSIKRQILTPQSVSEIVSNNLFRKERSEYSPPAMPKALSQPEKVSPKPALPLPKIILRGVILLNGTKIAFLEGSYPVAKQDKIEDVAIKRKGYYLGDQIGSYKIAQISKRGVVLDSSLEKIIEIKLKKGATRINETSEYKQLKRKVISAQPVSNKRRQPTPRISGSLLTPLPKHISGR